MPWRVGQDLDLDVARPLEGLLEVDPVVAEGALRFAAGSGERALQLVRPAHETQALAPSARGRLEHQGEAEAEGLVPDGREVGHGMQASGDHGHAGFHRQPAGRGLLAHQGDRLAARTDERDPGLLTRPGEGRVLRQEAVAGMDGVGLHALRHLQDPVDAQIAVARGGRAHGMCFVGLADVQRRPVGLRVDGHRPDAHLAAGPDDADRDLPAIGDQDLPEGSFAQSGMLPCLRGGFRSRLVLVICRPAMIFRRVCRGSITSSMNPRSAAT